MITAITQGVKVSVETAYEPRQSAPQHAHFLFAYRITIENCGAHTVQLLRRHWHIWDSDGTRREVEGEGVIGEQPTLEPGEAYQYVSGCNLKTEMGKMFGTYTMLRLMDQQTFEVDIPEFLLLVPFKLN